MGNWWNVTNTFSEERRHYSNTYLEICEVYDEAVEVSVFSAVANPYEIYVSYGIMYGIIYCDKEEAYEKFEEIKQVLQKDYEENKEPSDEFMRMFIDTYGLCLPNDVLFDEASLWNLMKWIILFHQILNNGLF